MSNKYNYIALVLNIILTIFGFGGNFFIIKILQLFNNQGFYPYVAFALNIIFLITIFFLVRLSFKKGENRNLAIVNLIMLVVSSFLFFRSILFIALAVLGGGF